MIPNILSVLTQEECGNLAEAALKVLAEMGVLVTLPEAVDRLIAAGGWRGEDGRVRLEGELVRRMMAQAPKRFALHDRCGGRLEIGQGRSWTLCGGTVARMVDWPDGTVREATRDDGARLARLCDALPLVHCTVPMVEPQDVPSRHAEIIAFLDTLINTSKFVLACPVAHASARAWVEMGRIATGRKNLAEQPAIGLLVTMLPSLHLDDDCTATSMLAAEEGVPLIAMAGAMAGSSAPNTVAGVAVLKLAGALFIATLAQIVRPGTPVFLDCGAVALDMNTADIGEAGPEYSLGAVAQAQAARELGLPTYSCALHCEAKQVDFQAGMEKMAGMMASLLARVDLTTNMGMLSRCSAASFEQLLIDHELCAFLGRFGRGVTVDDDTLGLDVVHQVGLGGNFMLHEHTLKHCRSGEIWYPTLLDRTAVAVEAGDLRIRAHAQVQEILKTHRPQVDGETRRDLVAYVERLVQKRCNYPVLLNKC